MKDTNQNHTETLICPHCGEEIALEEAFAHRVQDMVAAQLVAINASKQAEIAEINRQHQAQLQEQLRLQREESTGQMATLNERNGTLEAKLQEVENQKEQEITNRLALERVALAEQLNQQIREENRQAVADKDQLIADLTAEKLRTAADQRLRDADKDQTIERYKADVARLTQRIEQGSIQQQGESLEVVFESQLAHAFPHDRIEPIGKGKPGADNVHHVRTTIGIECGTILWETKRALSWNNDWITKLKTDQRTAKSEVCVIVCTPSCMPKDKDLHGFGHYRGVLVCEHSYAIALAAILRERLAAEAQIRAQQANGSEEKEQLHAFACNDFHPLVVTVVESIVAQLDQLNKEKVSTQNKWAGRERQINAAMAAIAKLYGGIQSIVGSGTLPNLPTLMLEAKASPKLL